ncbi:S16 family serine protease, partial [Gulbenkiania mobilis]|uniref:S16 family serine protease n=1 Tax=Gulbenkiania mobilis TaxID=397457 RepID=UPI001910C67E
MSDIGVPGAIAAGKGSPSAFAGITMASALLSLARNQPPKKGVAMTGELTLTGHVLPIGGVREKVIAARRQ